MAMAGRNGTWRRMGGTQGTQWWAPRGPATLALDIAGPDSGQEWGCAEQQGSRALQRAEGNGEPLTSVV